MEEQQRVASSSRGWLRGAAEHLRSRLRPLVLTDRKPHGREDWDDARPHQHPHEGARRVGCELLLPLADVARGSHGEGIGYGRDACESR